MEEKLRTLLEGDTVQAARGLLGWKLVRILPDGRRIEAVVTETEAYKGPEDRGSHSFNNRRTKRTDVMFRKAGTVYVYLVYGLHLCLNLVTEGADYPAAVLIRGCVPLDASADVVSLNRTGLAFGSLSPVQRKNLLNGPGKVAQGLLLGMEQNGGLLGECGLFLEPCLHIPPEAVEALPRVGIGYAGECREWLWRFRVRAGLLPHPLPACSASPAP